jgi:hypothetical protein
MAQHGGCQVGAALYRRHLSCSVHEILNVLVDPVCETGRSAMHRAHLSPK